MNDQYIFPAQTDFNCYVMILLQYQSFVSGKKETIKVIQKCGVHDDIEPSREQECREAALYYTRALTFFFVTFLFFGQFSIP